ncbi:MAG: hypothetical protein FWF83_01320 [Clostridiales bacterium]|nr:hypothetical protein [Clostridiales bacterium]
MAIVGKSGQAFDGTIEMADAKEGESKIDATDAKVVEGLAEGKIDFAGRKESEETIGKALDLEVVKTLQEGDSAALGGRVMATEVVTSGAGASKARYYMKMNYQTGQFLRAEDFLDEQAYHTRKLRDHNKALHVHGICEGLIVKGSKYPGCVEVGEGSAIDIMGNSMILETPEIVDLGSACRDGNVYIENIFLFIRFGEALATDTTYLATEGNSTISTRVVEKPLFYACRAVPGGSKENLNADQLLLAVIRRDINTGEIADPDKDIDSDPPGRRLASVQLKVVDPKDVDDNVIESRHIKNGAVTAEKIAGVVFDSMQLADEAVTERHIKRENVTESRISPGAVTESRILNDAVTANKIRDLNVTERKIGTGAVTADKIGEEAVTASKIKDGTITPAKLNPNVLSAIQLTTNSVKSHMIEANAVTTAKILDGAVGNTKIDNKAVTSSKIADGVIYRNHISKKAITSTHLANASVNIGAIQTHAVTFDKTNCFVEEVEASVTPNYYRIISLTLSEEEMQYPAGATVYPTTRYVGTTSTQLYVTNAYTTQNVSGGNNVIWYERTTMLSTGRYTRQVYIYNNYNYAVNLKVVQWYWKHYVKK